VAAGYSFPAMAFHPITDTYRPSVEKLGFKDLHDSCLEILGFFEGRTAAQVDVSCWSGTGDTRILNSSGLDARHRYSMFGGGANILFPNTETSISDWFVFSERSPFPREKLERMLELHGMGLPEVEVGAGRMKVLFLPFAMHTISWRLSAAASGASFARKASPLLEKLGEKVASDGFTWYDDPLDRAAVGGCCPFDDEGVPTRKTAIIENGVFRTVFNNLDYASKLDSEPTGHGYRSSSMWGGDPVTTLPSPGLSAPGFEPGSTSFEDMIAGIDRGVILFGVLGAHSGNILNGDFSVGMNPGLLVENGVIRGRVRDGMVSGNIWDALQRVVAVENQVHNPLGGASRYPAILLDGVSVAAKG